MMIPCVVLLSLDPKEVDEAEVKDKDEELVTEKEMRLYGIVAVSFGILAPLFWLVKVYYIRLTIDDKSFVLYDMAIDS